MSYVSLQLSADLAMNFEFYKIHEINTKSETVIEEEKEEGTDTNKSSIYFQISAGIRCEAVPQET